MQIQMRVDTGSGPRDVVSTMWAIVQWERRFKLKASDMAKAMGMEDLAFIAYASEQAAGNPTPAVFDDYVKKIRSIEVVSEETENPTQEAPTDGS